MVIAREVLCFPEIAGIRVHCFYRLFYYFSALQGVALHQPELLVGQLARLVEHSVGNRNLADIVKRRRVHDLLDIFVVDNIRVDAVCLHLLHNYTRVGCCFADVVARALVAALYHIRENNNQSALKLVNL